MTTATASPAPPRDRPLHRGARESVFDIELGPDPAALVRVLTVLRRRGCVITRVDFASADRHRPGHLTVALYPPPSHAASVAAWLNNVIDVVSVRARTS